MTGNGGDHWENVYRAKTPAETSWYQRRPGISLDLIAKYAPARDSILADIGGGASTLADHLLDMGYRNLSVLDVAPSALAHLQARLGARAESVDWIIADVTAWRPERRYDLWHDRAALHFQTAREDQTAYAEVLRSALKYGGVAVIAGFAPGGPEKCSGLPVVQHDAASLSALLGPEFSLLETRDEEHMTPWGGGQKFRYHAFRRAEN